MQFSQLIDPSGGAQALDTIGQAFGLDHKQVASMIDSVAPTR